ncbi:oxidoreductase [Deltaproteobacteria bacterium]|nr:oxidoreductase [Deltaproteobacteria bacterium]
MIISAADLTVSTIKADLCVIGTGPGGSMVAMVAAEAGLRVVALEAGALVTPGEMNQREADMFPRLLWDAGGRTTMDKAIRIHQGHGVGGSALHNLNLCKRIPASIQARWRADRGDGPPWEALYDEVEALLEVKDVDSGMVNRHNQLLAAGAAALGWEHGLLRHNRTGCIGSGYCEVGCAFDAKNNALKMLVPRAVKAGAAIVALAQAVRIDHSGGRVRGVDAVRLDPHTRQPVGTLRIDAPLVCVSASATGTPALLLRSRVPDPSETTGNSLRIHPAVVAAGEFAEAVHAWRGVPQSVECTEFLKLDDEDGPRTWIVPAFAHPVGVATLVPGLGEAHRAVMRHYPHLGALTAMIHDQTRGTVRPRGDLGVAIDYVPEAEDRAELRRGLAAAVRLLFAAGATRVLVPAGGAIELSRPDEVATKLSVDADLSAVHPMASVPMGVDPKTAAVGPTGKHHHLDGLWLSDASLFPTSIGVPPQLSVYALGLHVGRQLVEA